jgi:hypothetical protein
MTQVTLFKPRILIFLIWVGGWGGEDCSPEHGLVQTQRIVLFKMFLVTDLQAHKYLLPLNGNRYRTPAKKDNTFDSSKLYIYIYKL